MQHTATKAWLMVAKDRRNLNIRMVQEKGEFKRERERERSGLRKRTPAILELWLAEALPM